MGIFRYFSTGDTYFFQRIIILLCIFAQSMPTHADCDGIIKQLGEQLRYGDSDFSACKILPTDQTLSIVALANLQRSSAPDDSPELYDLDVFLVSNESGKMLRRLFRNGAFQSDAVALGGIAIDTARYQIAPQLRAFGIRASFASNSHSYSASVETINLYVSEGQVLKEILANLIMIESTGSGSSDFVAADDRCTGTVTEIKRTLDIGKVTSNGYQDLRIVEKKMQTDSKLVKNECQTTTSQSTKLYTLRFDGNVYEVPQELRYE